MKKQDAENKLYGMLEIMERGLAEDQPRIEADCARIEALAKSAGIPIFDYIKIHKDEIEYGTLNQLMVNHMPAKFL